MGNVFSCVIPKTERLKKPKDRWKKQKKSQLQKLFESNGDKLHHELLDAHLEAASGEMFAEETGAKNKKTNPEDIVIADLCCSDETRGTDCVKIGDKDLTSTDAMAQSDIYIEDIDLNDSENEALDPEPPKKIFHDKTENWVHFNTELAREYTEQLEDDFGEDFTDTAVAADDFADETADIGEELLDLVLARVDDIVAFHQRARRAEQAFKAFKNRAWRAANTPDELSDSEDSEDNDDDRFTPPPVEGDIYTGYGILKNINNKNENHKRCITWAPGVKPPASDKKDLDPLVESFMNERSRLALQRTPEEKRMRRKARLARASCRQVNNSNISGQIMAGYRIPVRVRTTRASGAAASEGVRPRQWSTPTRIPVAVKTRETELTPVTKHVSTIVKPVKKQSVTKLTEVSLPRSLYQTYVDELQRGTDRGISWPERVTYLYSVPTNAYHIEQFKRTELFRQSYRWRMTGCASWGKGLTPFQIWVVRHAATDEMTRVLQPTTMPGPNTAKARVTCWRRYCASY